MNERLQTIQYARFNSITVEVNKGFYFKGGDVLTGSNVGINRFTGSKGDYIISGSQLSGTIPRRTNTISFSLWFY